MSKNTAAILGFTLALTLFWLCPKVVKADEVNNASLLFGGVSYHTMSKDTTNSFHRALIGTYDDYLVGYLRNSYDQDSFVAAYRIYAEVKESYSTDVYLGAVRGYDKCFGRHEEGNQGKSKIIACPLLVISATIHTGTYVEPTISLWGDALVLTGRINF